MKYWKKMWKKNEKLKSLWKYWNISLQKIENEGRKSSVLIVINFVV